MKRVLITGGAGFIGSAITTSLVKQNNLVRVLDNESRGKFKKLTNLKGKIELIHGDIRDLQTVTKACEGVESVIHLAAVNGTQLFYSNPGLVLDVGVKGIINSLEAAKKQGVKEFFLFSTSEVYQTPPVIPAPENVPLVIPDPYNPRYSYAGSKIISELLLLHYAKDYFKRSIIIRPHNVYGPNMGTEHVIPQLIMRMQKLMKSKISPLKLPIQGTGNETRSFIFIEDFIKAFLLVMEKGKNRETYNIGTENEILIKDVAKKIIKNFDRIVLIVPGTLTEGSTSRRCPSVKKLRMLGFKPKVSFSQGVEKTVNWYNHLYS